MRTAILSVVTLVLLFSTSAFTASASIFTAAASSPADTVITRTITTDHITKMNVVGNIDLVLIKSDADKLEIRGANNLVAGLTVQNDSGSMLISEKMADRHTSGRIKVTLWLRINDIHEMSCTGGKIRVINKQ